MKIVRDTTGNAKQWIVSCILKKESGNTVNISSYTWLIDAASENEAKGIFVTKADTDRPGESIHNVIAMGLTIVEDKLA